MFFGSAGHYSLPIVLKTRRRERFLAWGLLCLALVIPSCGSVAYWDKERFADPVMAYQSDGTLLHFEHKVFQSIEGAAGGFGASAGGGCGCN